VKESAWQGRSGGFDIVTGPLTDIKVKKKSQRNLPPLGVDADGSMVSDILQYLYTIQYVHPAWMCLCREPI
jgi:hypothetical protein